jgi:DNA-binding transcriptional MerR regulator
MTIGEFSQITHLSIKTLRKYHEAGLLIPDYVDPQSSFRYYGLDQVALAQVIHRFRQLGMPVAEIAKLVAVTDPEVRAHLIAQHVERLEGQMRETQAALVALRRLVTPDQAPIEVTQQRSQPLTVAAVSDVVQLGDHLRWYSNAMAEIRDVIASSARDRIGPPGGLYDNELFTDERGTMLVYIPVVDPPAVGHVSPFTIPEADLASTIHYGPHDDIDVTYAALGAYVKENQMDVAGPVREVYHVGPWDTGDSTQWRTEIAWPVFRTVA